MTLKMRHCFYCGAQLGAYADWDPLDNCGARECARAAAEAQEAEREEAHRRLDQDRGWDR